MTRSANSSLTQRKYCSLWIGITSDSVQNMVANLWLCLVKLLVLNQWLPTNCSRLIWLNQKEESTWGIIVGNFFKMLYECTATGLHLRAIDANSESFSVYIYRNQLRKFFTNCESLAPNHWVTCLVPKHITGVGSHSHSGSPASNSIHSSPNGDEETKKQTRVSAISNKPKIDTKIGQLVTISHVTVSLCIKVAGLGFYT